MNEHQRKEMKIIDAATARALQVDDQRAIRNRVSTNVLIF